MMDTFLSKVMTGQPPCPNKIEGYSNFEIKRLEDIYDIEIKGDLELFFSQIGRCMGGIIGDDSLITYRDHWSVDMHKNYQFGSRQDLIEEGLKEYVGEGEFFFSCESDGCLNYFLRTKSLQPDVVYEYDGNEVRATNYSFIQHMRRLIKNTLSYTKELQDHTSKEYKILHLSKESIPPAAWNNLIGKKPLVFRGNMLSNS